MNVAVIQMNVSTNKVENVRKAKELIRDSCKVEKIDLVVLPEMFNTPYDINIFADYAEGEDEFTTREMAKLAADLSIYIVAGSIVEKEDNKLYNTSYVFDRNGNQISKHRKVHLFDIDIKDGQYFKESEVLSSGDKISSFETEFGRIGHMICYDIRFPEFSRLLIEEEVKMVIVPGAFNMTTGPLHWEILFRTRALDNQMYYIGCAPARDLTSSYHSYGNSIIVDPWGNVEQRLDEREGVMIHNIDFKKVSEVREQLPLLKHRRPNVYKKSTQ